jgi:hypothetical protein
VSKRPIWPLVVVGAALAFAAAYIVGHSGNDAGALDVKPKTKACDSSFVVTVTAKKAGISYTVTADGKSIRHGSGTLKKADDTARFTVDAGTRTVRLDYHGPSKDAATHHVDKPATHPASCTRPKTTPSKR